MAAGRAVGREVAAGRAERRDVAAGRAERRDVAAGRAEGRDGAGLSGADFLDSGSHHFVHVAGVVEESAGTSVLAAQGLECRFSALRRVGALDDARVFKLACGLQASTESFIDDKAVKTLQALPVEAALEALRKTEHHIRSQGGGCRSLSVLLQSLCRVVDSSWTDKAAASGTSGAARRRMRAARAG